jgi:hypothetical protein
MNISKTHTRTIETDVRTVIHWDRPMLDRFSSAIETATADTVDTFVFDGHTFVLAYARYLRTYLETRIAP